MTDDNSGRPICFAFPGDTDLSGGSTIRLEARLLRKSVNYRQMKAGYAYPLYYRTLFAELRKVFNEALAKAKAKRVGYWLKDRTTRGVTIHSEADLAIIPPIWPKLWRRLQAYLGKNASLANFISFLEEKNERVDVLSKMSEVGLQNLVEVDGNSVKPTERPENLRVVAKAGRRR